MKLPDSFERLFRNYNFCKIDTEKHERMIIKTTLVLGTWEQILWLFEFYGKDKIGNVFCEDINGLRELPEPVVNLWELLFLDEHQNANELEGRGAESKLKKWSCRRRVPVTDAVYS
jgi:hypothetical protein